MKKTLIIYFFVLSFQSLALMSMEQDKNKLILGTIIDAESNLVIAGATVRLVETNKGTYTNRTGQFRLSVPPGKQILRISSLGYETTKINLQERNDSIIVKLKPSSVLLRSVDVTANITAKQVVARAIAKKRENMSKIKTFSGLLYSKLTIELGGSMLQGSADKPGAFTIGIPSITGGKEENSDGFKLFVLESFARNAIDFTKKVNHTTIIQRRQTANISAENNLLALGNYQSFYEERIKIINADFATPLAEDAFDFYDFEITDKTMIDNRFVYVISVVPKTKTYPAFAGTIKVIEGTYNLIEVSLAPSNSSAISFVENLAYIQKFEEVKADLWYPTYLDVTAKANIEVLKGFADIKADFRATSIYSEMAVNQVLPDSVYAKEIARVTVSNLADSTDSYFWERNSLREISAKELDMYERVEKVVKEQDSAAANKSFAKFTWDSFFFDFNRVGAISLGWTPYINIYDLQIDSKYYYSFGQKRSFGELGALYILPLSDKVDLSLRANAFSLIAEAGNNQSYSRFVNSILSALSHKDYYNYFRKDGMQAGFEIGYNSFSFWSEFESSRHSALGISTRRSIFYKDKDWRSNPIAESGNFKTISLGTSVGGADNMNLTGTFDYLIDVNAIYGDKQSENKCFRAIEAKTKLAVPTFKTGYLRMLLELEVNAGVASPNLPVQYQFLLNSNMLHIEAGTFLSAPLGKYGGTEYIAAQVNFNMRDLFWRAMRLPLYKGRGIELIAGASAAKFNNLSASEFLSTKNGAYLEAGFGLGRIPTFITDVMFLEANFRWGIGDLAKNRFGFALNISSPF